MNEWIRIFHYYQLNRVLSGLQADLLTYSHSWLISFLFMYCICKFYVKFKVVIYQNIVPDQKAHCAYSVIFPVDRGQKLPHIWNPWPLRYLPIHFATFMGLWWRLMVVYGWKLAILGWKFSNLVSPNIPFRGVLRGSF